MVGMTSNAKEKTSNVLHLIKYTTDMPLKLQYLDQFKEILLKNGDSLCSEFFPNLVEFQKDRFSPIRKLLAQIIGEIGSTCTELIPEIVPVLISFLEDDTPAVARQAISSGTDLFRSTLEKVAVKGLSASELDDSLKTSWEWMLKFKDAVCPIAFQKHGTDGIRLLAIKFVEAIVLLYTPDPNGSSEPPPHQSSEGKLEGFSISWLRGGHPVLNVADLSMEASQSLGLLLDQLRFPTVKSLSNLTIIVLINSLSTIANKRPAFYGRILPVLLGLEPSSSVVKGVRVTGAHHALKKAFLSCLQCTHPGAAPWCERLVGAMKEMEDGKLVEHTTAGSLDAGTCESQSTEEEKPLIKAYDAVQESGRKRSMIQEISDPEQDDGVTGKRARSSPINSEGSNRDRKPNLNQGTLSSNGATSSTGDGETGTVQQLVAMFGALVAQGDKAAGSLEILLSSISADLLGEVVMANMRRLPPTFEEDEQIMSNMSSLLNVADSNSLASHLMSLVSDIPSLSAVFQQKHLEDEHQEVVTPEIDSVFGSRNDTIATIASTIMTNPGSVGHPIRPKYESPTMSSDMHDAGTPESGIPGLDSSAFADAMPEAPGASHLTNVDTEGESQDKVTNSDGSFLMDYSSTVSVLADKTEEFGLQVPVSDTNSVISTSISSQCILPKMSAPVVELTDEQKDELQKTAFIRIIEAYKQISIAGASDVRFSLLAYLGVEYPLELDPWKLLQEHISSDYLTYEGHELTLRVLYRLFGEAEKENDFFSSTTATSVYETFLLTVAETLRDSFPASDKSLSRLFGEVPYLPGPAFKLLESLCSPGSSEITDKEAQSGDRVTQGLSAVWSLILQRPPIRDICLKIALQSAVHQLEEVRMKAIRLVANKLYPISSIAQQIEDFANEMLLSVTKRNTTEGLDTEGPTPEVQKDVDVEKPSNDQLLSKTGVEEVSSDTHQPCSTSNTATSLISEAQRCMSLYFALCTKKRSLFRQIFIIYKSIPKAVTEAVHRHIPILVRTIGSSPEILAIISDPPSGSESLLLQVLHILTDGTVPSPDLVYTVKKLYDSKLKDVGILIPVLSSLPKEEVLPIFPKLVNLPADKFQTALARMLQGSSHSSPILSPAEVLIAIHGIDPEKDGIALKKVMDACNACFEQRQVFTQQVLAKVLNQLVEQIPLPLLFMRTVLQAIGAFPALVDFIMEILSRLVTKQIWKYPKLWVGFLKCALMTQPQSFGVLLQLPAAQLESALSRTAASLKAPLIAHAEQPSIRSSLPRSTLVVLGLAQDSQASSQAPKSPSHQTTETSNSVTVAEGATDPKELSTAS
ncbi:uncharacterized protein LOC113321634 [Papaver somniferum]|uniref:uncharacterized protein LOC113321634 n=1 Tax=Papaver somniferum TaxID=3469 RepID=UPI000E7034E8|nr:uncharacterized protein LOC113321634 [Papaver somniferum]